MNQRQAKFVWPIWLAVLAGCATEAREDSAFIEPGPRSETRRELPVLVNGLDGQVLLKYRAPIPVKPGRHTVDVYFSSGVVAGGAEKHRRTLEIDAAPCTRYLIVARYTHPLTTSAEWEPVVYPEKIADCPGG